MTTGTWLHLFYSDFLEEVGTFLDLILLQGLAKMSSLNLGQLILEIYIYIIISSVSAEFSSSFISCGSVRPLYLIVWSFRVVSDGTDAEDSKLWQLLDSKIRCLLASTKSCPRKSWFVESGQVVSVFGCFW